MPRKPNWAPLPHDRDALASEVAILVARYRYRNRGPRPPQSWAATTMGWHRASGIGRGAAEAEA